MLRAGLLLLLSAAVLAGGVAGQQQQQQPADLNHGAGPDRGRGDILEEVCKDKQAGDDCKAVTADNHTVEGECFNGAPVDVVDHLPPLHCKLSHPGEVACKHKQEDDACTFSRPGDSETSEGKCFKTPHGTLMCRHRRESGPGGRPGGDGRADDEGFLPPHLACKNLTVGDECKTHGPTNLGICLALPGAKEIVHCRSVMPAEKACMGKEKDAECEFDRPGGPSAPEDEGKEDSKTEKGTCMAMGRHDVDLMLCRPKDRGGMHARLSSLSPEEQQEFTKKQARLREIRGMPNYRDDAALWKEYKELKDALRKIRDSPTSQAAAAEAVSLVAARLLRGSK